MSRFNLLSDAWISVKGRDKPISVCEIVQPDIIALDAPRADFNAALMQFLIGIFQTVFAPKNPREWRKFFAAPPSESELQEKLDEIRPAFYLDGDGYRFMQDSSIQQKGNSIPIEEIIFGAPGDNTKKKNTDFFIKEKNIEGLCASCTASAILAANIFADNGGPSYFESMRGNGFISNIVCVDEKQSNGSLWKNIWLNVMLEKDFCKNIDNEKFLWMKSVPDDVEKRKQFSDEIKQLDADIKQQDILIFGTKDKGELSEFRKHKKELQKRKKDTQQARKNITSIYPENANILQTYWAWMRRLHLKIEPSDALCSVCSKNKIISKGVYKTNKAYNYPKYLWKHPLSAYKTAESGEYEGNFLALEMTVKGLPYTYWNDFIQTTEKIFPAQVVSHHINRSRFDEQLIIWSFGYAMDSNTALGWFESSTPLYLVEDEACRKLIEIEIQRFVQASVKISDGRNGYLTNAIKNAWFDEDTNKNKGQKKSFIGNKSIEIGNHFLSQTHDKFYQLIGQLFNQPELLDDVTQIKFRTDWYCHIKEVSEHVFNQWAFKASIKTNPKRIALAHKQLMQNINSKSLMQDTLGLPKEK